MQLFRFIPKNVKFSALFARAGDNAVETARAFLDLLEHYENVEAKVRHLRDLEHEGDRLSREVVSALSVTFITPFDREDILELGNHIDDFVDFIEEAARRMWLYKLDAPTEQAIAFARIMLGQAELLARAMPMLEDPKRAGELSDITRQVSRLEDEGDRVQDEVQARLFDGAATIPDLVRAIRWGEIYTLLEDGTDQAQRVANTVQGIVLKNA